jgi:hypothetical protein
MSRLTSLPFVLGISAPRWVVVVTLVCWAILPGPAHAQPLAKESTLPGSNSRSSIVAVDRSPSLQTSDRRYDAAPGDGNPNQLATDSITIAATGLSAIHLAKFFFDAPAAQQPRSPAQPRAPPAGAKRSH